MRFNFGFIVVDLEFFHCVQWNLLLEVFTKADKADCSIVYFRMVSVVVIVASINSITITNIFVVVVVVISNVADIVTDVTIFVNYWTRSKFVSKGLNA